MALCSNFDKVGAFLKHTHTHCVCVCVHVSVSKLLSYSLYFIFKLRSKALVLDDISLIPLQKQAGSLENCTALFTYKQVGFLNTENKVCDLYLLFMTCCST